jgi:hypothetical protein
VAENPRCFLDDDDQHFFVLPDNTRQEIWKMAAERDPKQNSASAVVDDDEPDDW